MPVRFAGKALSLFILLSAAPPQSDGQAVAIMSDGVAVQRGSLTVRVHVCADSILRVTATPRPSSRIPPSLTVIAAWDRVRWCLRQDDTTVTVGTPHVSARIDLRTGSIRFFDGRGRLLVREDPDRPHECAPAVVAGEQVYHVTQKFRLAPDEGIYGLGQFEDGAMNYRGRHVELIQNNRHIVVPFLVSTRRYGILWDNPSHTRFHDGPDGATFWSEVADGIDYYLIAGDTMDKVIAGYREATGRAPMFPRWAFGYWQSKERYENQSQLMSVVREYRRRQIPIDNIVQDWQYWGRLGWNAMAFDSSLYPDPAGMIDSLHRLYHMQIMVSIWPQVDPATAVYRELKERGHLYPTVIWNGGKTYDAYSSDARAIYWDHLNRGLYALGVDAWWVDATEPDWKWCDSLFEEKEGIVSNGMTAIGSSSRYLNTYALMTTTAIYEHQRATNPARRVMMLTRSAFAGQQRNAAAVWSGDISSNWRTFRNQIAAGINFSMAGIPYWNSDIGGFLPKEYGGEYPLGPRDPAYRELYTRWFQFGAFCPIFRAHGTDFPREVWQFGGPGDWAYDALVKFIHLRYRLLPYVYSLAWSVTSDHGSMMRGLPMDFPDDPRACSSGDEFLFGPSILVAPVTHEMYYPKHPGVIIPWSELRTPSGLTGLSGEYYRGKNFDTLAATRRDSAISFHWTGSGPEGVGPFDFSVRWSGFVRAPETGKYDFEIISDDGVNLWVDERQIMDEMYPAGRQINVGETELEGGRWYAIRLEYQQIDQGAEIALTWRTPSMLASYRPAKVVNPDTVYLPKGTRWYDFWTGERHVGGVELSSVVPPDMMPLYVREGSILPLGPVMQYATERAADPIELRIYRGAGARFELYEDENDGYGYERGVHAIIPIRWEEKERTLTIGRRKGAFPGMLETRRFNIILVEKGHGAGGDPTPLPDRIVRYAGSPVTVRFPAP